MAMLATTTKTAPQQARSRSLPESFSLLRRMRVASLAVSEPTDQRIRRPSIYSPNRLRPIFFASRPRTGDQPPQTELPSKTRTHPKTKASNRMQSAQRCSRSVKLSLPGLHTSAATTGWYLWQPRVLLDWFHKGHQRMAFQLLRDQGRINTRSAKPSNAGHFLFSNSLRIASQQKNSKNWVTDLTVKKILTAD